MMEGLADKRRFVSKVAQLIADFGLTQMEGFCPVLSAIKTDHSSPHLTAIFTNTMIKACHDWYKFAGL